jgi:hypothetical protein
MAHRATGISQLTISSGLKELKANNKKKITSTVYQKLEVDEKR